jgi:UDP-N-acetylglucosamine 2-epimerase (non-hydrolysing)
MSTTKVAILVGTRPEIIKIAPVMRELKKQRIPYIFIHSNQHYAKELDEAILKDLDLSKPDYQLQVGSGTHAVQTGKIMEGVENICIKEKITLMIVHGDTNTTLAGALTAKKLHIKVCHIEAGLRSFDYRMPEEINRIITDRISDILFAPTAMAQQNLLKEGIGGEAVIVTGNTVVDALLQHQTIAAKQDTFKRVAVQPNKYVLLTMHRAENVDEKPKLLSLIKVIDHVSKKLKLPVVWPVHPRSTKQLEAFEIKLPKSFVLIDSVGYLDMLQLLSNASMVLTDSGGVQEEAYILKRPLITLRNSTERPETLSANFIVDTSIKKVDHAIDAFKNGKVKWNNELGDGSASKTIVAAIKKLLKMRDH